MTTSRPTKLTARGPADLIALVPVVLGFHPQDSVVLLTFGPSGRSFHARVDLPAAAAEQHEVAGLLLDAVRRNGADRVALVLYTDDVRAAESQAAAVTDLLTGRGVEVVDVLRVDEGQWFAVPEDERGGTPYELESHRFTAQHVYDGGVVHRDRAALADTLVGTDEVDHAEVLVAATQHADRVQRALTAGAKAGFWRAEGRWVQRRVRECLTDGLTLSPADAGRMLVLSSLVPTRDVAWSEISRDRAAAHVVLWRDLVRRAPRDLVPGVASLLAFAAWQRGDGALAWCAIDRCTEVDPDYSMAHCVAQALTAAMPPDAWEPVPAAELAVFSDEGAQAKPRDRAS